MHEGHDTAREVMMFTLPYHLTSEVPHFNNCLHVETNYNIEIDAVKVNFFFLKKTVMVKFSNTKFLVEHHDYLIRVHLPIMLHFMKYGFIIREIIYYASCLV